MCIRCNYIVNIIVLCMHPCWLKLKYTGHKMGEKWPIAKKYIPIREALCCFQNKVKRKKIKVILWFFSFFVALFFSNLIVKKAKKELCNNAMVGFKDIYSIYLKTHNKIICMGKIGNWSFLFPVFLL